MSGIDYLRAIRRTYHETPLCDEHENQTKNLSIDKCYDCTFALKETIDMLNFSILLVYLRRHCDADAA